MKILLSLLIFLSAFSSHAQLLDPTADWFSLRDYFDESFIKEKQIIALEISVSEKADGKSIEEAGEKFYYEFNASGRLTNSKKRIPLYRGFDTAWVEFNYDKAGRLIRSREHIGPYDFEYLYLFENDSLFSSVKLRPKADQADTLHYRKHQIKRKALFERENIANRKGIVFMQILRTSSEDALLIEEKLEYVFSKYSSRTTYLYQDGKLIEKRFKKDYGQHANSKWEYSYLNNMLDEINYYEKEKLKKRLAITYSDGLPSAVILRNVEDKEILIYRFNYTFY